MKYNELKAGITDHLNKAAEDFFIIGYFLRQINDGELYLEDGYKTIWEFAKGEYGLSTSSASRFMGINARFTIDDGQHMDEKYIGMGPSKLQEMLTLSDAELEKVTKEMTVKQIRELKKPEPVSYYGLTKTVYEEGSTLSTPGCGHKHNCFCCSMPCELRQEYRHCVDAPIGNPYPCTRIDEEARKNMEAGMYKEACQFLNPELAEHRAGDNEPSPCCRNCEHKVTCYSCCDKVTQEVEAEKRKKQEELRKEIEAKKPKPTQRDFEEFYDHSCVSKKDLDAAALKETFRNAGGGDGSYDYEGNIRGVSINYKKTVPWGQLSKEMKSIRLSRELKEAEEKKASAKPRPLDEAFKEMKDREAEQAKRPDIEGCIREFYSNLYEGTKIAIKGRNTKVITKQLKAECGETFESGENFGCIGGGINLYTNGGVKVFTWSRFTKQLFQFLDRNPDLEKDMEPEIIDAEFKEIEETEPEQAEEVTEDPPADEGEPEETRPDILDAEEETEDPGAYGIGEVKRLLMRYERDLKASLEIGADAPQPFTQNTKIIFDALSLLAAEMERKEAEDD